MAVLATAPGGWARAGLGPAATVERRAQAAGFALTAVCFGPARMAFGMLLPPMRAAFGLSPAAAGAVAAAGFAGFVVALVAASWMVRRWGAKLPMVIGGASACAGSAVVALAPSGAAMAAGVVIAASSAGFAWTPFNAVAERVVRPSRRDAALSTVSTGTTVGVVAMAAVAAAVAGLGIDWRWAWAGFALAGAGAAVGAWALLPPSMRLRPRAVLSGPPIDLRATMRGLSARAAWPLYGAAVAFGLASAIVGTFAVERAAGGDPAGAPLLGAAIFGLYGVLGLAGFATARMERAAGLAGVAAGCFAVSALSCALLAWGTPVASVIGAGLFGIVAMVFSVVMAIWTMRLFPPMPVIGLSAAVVAAALGSILGPPLAGLAAGAGGLGTAYAAAAAVCAVVAGLVPRLIRSGRASG